MYFALESSEIGYQVGAGEVHQHHIAVLEYKTVNIYGCTQGQFRKQVSALLYVASEIFSTVFMLGESGHCAVSHLTNELLKFTSAT